MGAAIPPLRKSYFHGFANGFARNASQSAYPKFWKNLVGAYCPSVGIQGPKLINWAKRAPDGVFSSGMGMDAWQYGPFGHVLRYDGTDDAVNIGTGIINLNGDWTISAMVCLDDISSNSYTVVGNSVGSSGASSYSMLMHRTDRSGFTFQWDAGPGNAFWPSNATTNATALKWHHLVLCRAATNTNIALIQDGRPVIGEGYSANFSNPVSGTWGIGSWDPVTPTNNMKGWIGDVLIWDCNMLQREMAELYDGAHPLVLNDEIQVFYSIPYSAPTVTTTSASSITTNSASSGGNVTSDGNQAVTARGVCWALTSNPTTANSHTTDGTGSGSFSSSLTGLSSGTTYHYRAYATNSRGTSYGSDLTFTTSSATGNPGVMMLLGVGG